jgi:small subunit ribosomal protein S20
VPNIKSAKKRVKVIATKTLRNKMLKSQLNTAIKKFKLAVESGEKEAAQVAYVAAVKRVDKAVSQGILHKNNAAHKKSQFTLMLNKIA